ncbi:MAG TPA: GDSL-type esterase/lipase family protein [Dehalococcoidia bacterium]|nr:GDSL-type esterase/lipase family protein [Dehalococcoidia bacterium]
MQVRLILTLTLVIAALLRYAPPDAAAATPVEVVAYGDSVTYLGDYLDEWGSHIRRDLQVTPDVTMRAAPGWRSGDLRSALESDPAFWEPLATADLVVVNIGYNDFFGMRSAYLEGSCGGDAGTACFDALVDTFATNWDAIMHVITARIRSSESALRVTDIYYSTAGLDQLPEYGNAFQVLSPYLARMNEHIHARAAHYGYEVAMVHLAYNGASGDEDPYAKGYLLSDVIHPSVSGHRVIADALRATGYAPLERTCADVDGNGVVNSADLGHIAYRFGTAVADDEWISVDVNADGHVNASDLGITAAQFSRRCSQRA